MKSGWMRLLVSVAISASMGTAMAVDCAAIRAQYNCPANEKYPLHLSFDDGPALQTTSVLEVLQREQVPATFFIIAEKIDCETVLQQCQQADPASDGKDCMAYRECQTRREILGKTKQMGHMIGSHSYRHLRYSGVAPDRMQRDFLASKRLLEPFFTTQPPLFRLPYGDGWFNRQQTGHVMQALQEAGFQHVDWQLSAFDWDEKNQQGDKILQNVLTQVCSRQKGGVVLFHDGVENQSHEGRLFTIEHLGEWLPAMRCVVDFKPLDYFVKGYQPR
ncbi:MAG: polysaccharide deacetylase family protein [Candidatus Thiothrix moscowensis]|nr:polysaccharide deacetylase family protein [Candidatus Thiothrix moscowensis]